MTYPSRKDDPKRCQQHVSDHTGFGYPQCSRQWKVDDNGHWCKAHSPEAVAARQKKAHNRFEAQHEERQRPFEEAKQLAKTNKNLVDLLTEIRACFSCQERGLCGEHDDRAAILVGATGTAGSPADVGSTPTASTNSGRS